jgi:hypothetical protein
VSDYLIALIEDETAKLQKILRSAHASDRRTLAQSFQDLTRKIHFENEKVSGAIIEKAYVLLDAVAGHVQDFDRRRLLAALIENAVREEGDNPEIFCRLLIDAVDASVMTFEDKTKNNATVGGRRLFDFFADHIDVLSDQAFKKVFDHSSLLTSYAGGIKDASNFMLGSSDPEFQATFPANHAFGSLFKLRLNDFEEEIDWNDYVGGGKNPKALAELMSDFLRAKDLGVQVEMHMADALLITNFIGHLAAIREVEWNHERQDFFDETIIAMVDLVVPKAPSLAVSNNLFRQAGTKSQMPWISQQYAEFFHEDLVSGFDFISTVELSAEVAEAVSQLGFYILLNAAQANRYLSRDSFYDNSAFMRSLAVHCTGPLSLEKPLGKLKPAERADLIDAIPDPALKRSLLNQYKSSRGRVLEQALGL